MGMRVKFETLFRGLMLVLFVTLAWSVWAAVQPATNKAPATSVANLPGALEKKVERLDERYLTFWLDRVDFLKEHSLFGQPLRKYPASLIYVLLAFYGSKLVDRATCVWLKKLAAKTETRLDDLLLELLHGPIKVLAFVLFLNLGLNMFNWPKKVESYLSKGLILIVAGS